MAKYSESMLKNFKNNFEKYNNEIIESMKNMCQEFENIDQVLNTPKSTKEMPKIISYLKTEISERQNDETFFCSKIDLAISRYSDYDDYVKSMLGGK